MSAARTATAASWSVVQTVRSSPELPMAKQPLPAPRTVVPLVLTCLLAGCSYLGPKLISTTRPDYNVAIQQTNSNELLLNLVRLRYRDPPYFMHVERVVSALEVERRLSGSVSAVQSANDTFGAGGDLRFLENPTVFYVPIVGEQFVRELMSPTELDTLLLLTYSGWSVERVFALTLQEANGLKNAPSASGPTPVREPEYKDFRSALRHLRALQMRKQVEMGRAGLAEESYIELRLGHEESDEDAVAFKRLMGLDASLNRFRITPGLGRGDGRTVVVATRPLIAVMNYLSQGVETPRADLEAGRVTRTAATDGGDFDWQEMLGGLFRVRAAVRAPANAAISVRYRNAWFYIEDSDLESKSTFALLTQLLALQSGSETTARPALNFSIGR